MKKLLILLLVCGIHFSVLGQVVRNYTLTINGDTSPLNATVENKNVILSFKKTDVLTIKFNELKRDISRKTVKITSDAESNGIVIGTFSRTNVKDDQSHVLNISFENLKLNGGPNHTYTVTIIGRKGKQNLFRFKLV